MDFKSDILNLLGALEGNNKETLVLGVKIKISDLAKECRLEIEKLRTELEERNFQ